MESAKEKIGSAAQHRDAPEQRTTELKPRTDTDFEGGTTVDIERQTLLIMKACEVVGVSRRTIYNWMAGGKVEYQFALQAGRSAFLPTPCGRGHRKNAASPYSTYAASHRRAC